jgi:hypothetical protein
VEDEFALSIRKENAQPARIRMHWRSSVRIFAAITFPFANYFVVPPKGDNVLIDSAAYLKPQLRSLADFHRWAEVKISFFQILPHAHANTFRPIEGDGTFAVAGGNVHTKTAFPSAAGDLHFEIERFPGAVQW